MNHIFISYRHEDPEHARKVRQLGELLRQAGIPVELDQFYLEKHPAGPDEGWPKWCEERANNSECVLIIGSLGWFSAYEGTEATGEGLGCANESGIFRQQLWNQKGVTSRFRLAYLDAGLESSAPTSLQRWEPFRFFTSYTDELERLVQWTSGQLRLQNVHSQTVRWPDPLPDFQPDLANRHLSEWPAIREMLSGKSQQRILFLEAESGYGKSELLHQAVIYAMQIGIPVCELDFRANYSDAGAILGQICTDVGEHLPNFSREGGNKTHLLVKDLRALRRPIFLVLDTFEKASGVFQDWVCQNLLAQVEQHAPALTVIVAGQPHLPDVHDVRWRTVAQHLFLGPIKNPAYWEAWLEKRYPGFRERNIDLGTLVLVSEGVPRTFSDYCRVVARQLVQPTADHHA